jgi:hypothetical protein
MKWRNRRTSQPAVIKIPPRPNFTYEATNKCKKYIERSSGLTSRTIYEASFRHKDFSSSAWAKYYDEVYFTIHINEQEFDSLDIGKYVTFNLELSNNSIYRLMEVCCVGANKLLIILSYLSPESEIKKLRIYVDPNLELPPLGSFVRLVMVPYDFDRYTTTIGN